MDKNKIKNELNKYSKEDIIDCLVEDSLFNFNDYQLKHFLYKLRSRKFLNALDRQQSEFDKVSKESSEAMNSYFKWKAKVIEKYGKDGQVRVADIPFEEIQIGAKLEEDFNKKNQIYLNLLKKDNRNNGNICR